VNDWAAASARQVLVVEDNPGECELLSLAWAEQERQARLHFEDGAETVWNLLSRGTRPLPYLILLDLKLRHSDGLRLLRQIRSDARLRAIPVIVFTSSDDQQDIAAAYAAGANGYVVKPATFVELLRFANDLGRFWLAWNRLPAPEPSPAC
jgi:CheY-like chemotaxis protein